MFNLKNFFYSGFIFCWASIILYTFSGCQSGDASNSSLKDWMEPNKKLKILSTTAMINDLVKQIGGEFVDTTVLIKGELDPHSYQLVKGDDEKLSFSDLIFFNGLGLEHGPSLKEYLKSHQKAISIGDKLIAEKPFLLLHFKNYADPHIWMDISMWANTVPYIVEALSQKDPEHAETFRQNGEKLAKLMMEAHDQVEKTLQEIPEGKRYLVTSHDAFSYFTRAYLADKGEDEKTWSKRFAAPEGLAPESQVSATDIQMIIDHLSKYRIHVIFPESNVNRDSIKKIVQAGKQKGLDIFMSEIPLYADAMGKAGSDGDTYLKMIQHNAKVIGDNLKKNGG